MAFALDIHRHRKEMLAPFRVPRCQVFADRIGKRFLAGVAPRRAGAVEYRDAEAGHGEDAGLSRRTPQDRRLVARDAMLAAGHRMRRRAALGLSPTP